MTCVKRLLKDMKLTLSCHSIFKIIILSHYNRVLKNIIVGYSLPSCTSSKYPPLHITLSYFIRKFTRSVSWLRTVMYVYIALYMYIHYVKRKKNFPLIKQRKIRG